MEPINNKTDLYLLSPKTFHLEMPLYHDFDLSEESIRQKIYRLITNENTVDAYCIWCKKESVFEVDNPFYDPISTPSWINRNDGLLEITHNCTRDNEHKYHTYYFKKGTFFTKAGQFPSTADFQIPQAENYRKILGEEQYKEYTRGIGLSAYGVGIGSFVYLRRIFEKLIIEAYLKTKSENIAFDDEIYKKARMDEKIKMVKKYLPEFLVENSNLYTILSKGIHELNEDECLQYFETVKIGIELILDEKIIQKENTDKANKAKEAINKIHSDINGKTSVPS